MELNEPLVSEYGTKFPAELVQKTQLLWKSPADPHRGLNSSIIRLSYLTNLVSSRMLLHHCRCVQECMIMPLLNLWALCKASGCWNQLELLGSIGEGYRSVWEVCVKLLCELYFAAGVITLGMAVIVVFLCIISSRTTFLLLLLEIP
jgi:hypothetical protein